MYEMAMTTVRAAIAKPAAGNSGIPPALLEVEEELVDFAELVELLEVVTWDEDVVEVVVEVELEVLVPVLVLVVVLPVVEVVDLVVDVVDVVDDVDVEVLEVVDVVVVDVMVDAVEVVVVVEEEVVVPVAETQTSVCETCTVYPKVREHEMGDPYAPQVALIT